MSAQACQRVRPTRMHQGLRDLRCERYINAVQLLREFKPIEQNERTRPTRRRTLRRAQAETNKGACIFVGARSLRHLNQVLNPLIINGRGKFQQVWNRERGVCEQGILTTKGDELQQECLKEMARGVDCRLIAARESEVDRDRFALLSEKFIISLTQKL